MTPVPRDLLMVWGAETERGPGSRWPRVPACSEAPAPPPSARPWGVDPVSPRGSAASPVTARGARCIRFLSFLIPERVGPRSSTHRAAPGTQAAPCPLCGSVSFQPQRVWWEVRSALLTRVWVDRGPLPRTEGPWGGTRTLLHDLCELPRRGAVQGTGLPSSALHAPGQAGSAHLPPLPPGNWCPGRTPDPTDAASFRALEFVLRGLGRQPMDPWHRPSLAAVTAGRGWSVPGQWVAQLG